MAGADPNVRISHEQKSIMKVGYGANAAAYKAFFDKVPDTAKIDVTSYAGDAREPSETTITATWTPED